MVLSILLLDDNLARIDFLKNSLSFCNFILTNNSTNIEDYVNHRLDLIITKSNLLLSKLSKNIIDNVPTIVMVEKDDPNLLKYIEIGISDYIQLPLTQEDIIARIHLQSYRKKIIIDKFIDSLSNTYNKEYLLEKLEILLSKNNELPLSIVMIDLDMFKNINDIYGHLTGDSILKQIGSLLNREIRSDDILARFGGDEFILLLPKTSINQASLVAERIRIAIAKTFFKTSKDNYTNTTASFGITELNQSDSIESFINRADKALYIAKHQGKNQIFTHKNTIADNQDI